MAADLKPLVGKRVYSTRPGLPIDGTLIGLDGPDWGVIEYEYREHGQTKTGRSMVHREDIEEPQRHGD